MKETIVKYRQLIRPYWLVFKHFVISHAYSLILSIGTMIYGLQLIRYPEILATYSVYRHIVKIIDYQWIGVIFLVLGLAKLIGLIIDNKRLRRYSIVALTYTWSFFSLSFLLSEPPNTVWVFAGIMTMVAIGTSIRGDFRK